MIMASISSNPSRLSLQRWVYLQIILGFPSILMMQCLRMHSRQPSVKNSDSITSASSLLIFCTNLNLECGRQCLPILSGCFLQLVKMPSMNLIVGKSALPRRLHGFISNLRKITRFRCIGNFGQSTIRSFAYMNVTDMKNWAARTYEDCLQVRKLFALNNF